MLVARAPSVILPIDLIEKAKRAKRESKYLEFKSAFDPSSTEHWCEIIKDIVAISNSGGGVIAFGLDSLGNPTVSDLSSLLALDLSVMGDKIHRYTSVHFSGFDLSEQERDGTRIAVLQIDGSNVPMVFVRPGTYPIKGSHQQKTAFSQGTVYFRHGAKSEPGNSEDLRNVIERNLEIRRRAWLDGIRKVVTAPQGSGVTIFPGEVRESTSPTAVAIRVVDDPSAPAFRVIDPDVTHPNRQKELIDEVNKGLPIGATINSYDVLVVRKTYDTDSREDFYHRSKFGNPQYSYAFVDWLLESYAEDRRFFLKARENYYKATH